VLRLARVQQQGHPASTHGHQAGEQRQNAAGQGLSSGALAWLISANSKQAQQTGCQAGAAGPEGRSPDRAAWCDGASLRATRSCNTLTQ